MVSLRGGELWLLALRRRLGVDGRSAGEVRLVPGLRIALAQDLEVEVVSVALPPVAMGLAAPGLPSMTLPSVCSVWTRPELRITGRHEPDAPCAIWDTVDGWRRRIAGVTRPLVHGEVFVVEGVELRAVEVPLSDAGTNATRVTGGVDPPLSIITSYETAQIQVGEAPPVILAGIHAKILSELAALRGPASWEVVAREIWPEEADVWVLRRRWDVSLGRLRARLRQGNVRGDLIRAVGTGQVELVLRQSDRLEDRG